MESQYITKPDEEVASIIRIARKHGLLERDTYHGGELAIAINRVFCHGTATYIGCISNYFRDNLVVYGRIGVKLPSGNILDYEGKVYTREEMERDWKYIDLVTPKSMELAQLHGLDTKVITQTDGGGGHLSFFSTDEKLLRNANAREADILQGILIAVNALVEKGLLT